MKIVIDGNIGCGKSTVIDRICNQLDIPMFLEPVDSWSEWLSMFYENSERWRFSMNLKVLMSFSKWRENNFFGLYERSPLSNKYVFTEIQKLHPLEQQLFEEVYDKVSWTPYLIIYVKTDPEICMLRMKKRARDCEKNVSIGYLKKVHEKYEKLYGNNKYNVITIDGNRDQDEVYNEILKLIEHNKKEYEELKVYL